MSSSYRYLGESMNNNQEDETEELQNRIQKKFIRNIVKPYPSSTFLSNNLPEYDHQEIPSSSSLHMNAAPVMEAAVTKTPLFTSVIPTATHNKPKAEETVTIHCIDVNKHVNTCPVCAQIYRPNIIGVLITIIIILVVVILFLLKKLLQF